MSASPRRRRRSSSSSSRGGADASGKTSSTLSLNKIKRGVERAEFNYDYKTLLARLHDLVLAGGEDAQATERLLQVLGNAWLTSPQELPFQLLCFLVGNKIPALTKLVQDCRSRSPLVPLRALPINPALAMSLHGHRSHVYSVCVLPKARFFASASEDGTVVVWNRESGVALRVCTGHEEAVTCLTTTPDGRLISGSWDRTIRVWKTMQGRCLTVLHGHTKWVLCVAVAVSPNGLLLLSGSEDSTVRVWDLERDYRLLATMTGHQDLVQCIVASRDGRVAISGGNDAALMVWDLERRKLVRTMLGHDGTVRCVALIDNDHIVSGGEDHTLIIWSFRTGKKLHILQGHMDAVAGIAVAPDGAHIFSVSEDRTLRAWDRASNRCCNFQVGHNSAATCVAVVDSSTVVTGAMDETVRLWRWQDPPGESAPERISSIAVIPGAQYVVTGNNTEQGKDESARVKVWEIASGRCKAILLGHTKEVQAVAASPDSKLVASGAADTDVRIWDWSRNLCVMTCPGHSSLVQCVTFIADGERLISGSWDETVRIWDVVSGKEVMKFSTDDVVYSLATCLRSKYCFTSLGVKDDAVVAVWDLETGKRVRDLDGHTDGISGLAITPDGDHLISASDDGVVRVYHWDSGQLVREMKGHTKWVQSVAVLPDGKHCITCGGLTDNDGTLRVWDWTTGVAESVLHPPTGAPTCLAISQDRHGPVAVVGLESGHMLMCAINTNPSVATNI